MVWTMKLMLDGKYKQVGVWSFLKCQVLAYLLFFLIFEVGSFIVGFLAGFSAP